MGFDTREYEWADITLTVAGEDITGIRGVKVKEKVEREPIYAKGRQPHSIQSGNASYTIEIMVLQSAYEKLVKKGNGSVMAISADALISFGNPNNGDAIINKRATGIRFEEAETGMKQGDKFMEVTLPGVCLNIENVK